MHINLIFLEIQDTIQYIPVGFGTNQKELQLILQCLKLTRPAFSYFMGYIFIETRHQLTLIFSHIFKHECNSYIWQNVVSLQVLLANGSVYISLGRVCKGKTQRGDQWPTSLPAGHDNGKPHGCSPRYFLSLMNMRKFKIPEDTWRWDGIS